MAPSRTTTVKSKHAANKSGIRNSKNSTKSQGDGGSKQRKPPKSKAPVSTSIEVKRRSRKEEEAPDLQQEGIGRADSNLIMPVGVEKPKGKKKGKVSVDDRVCPTLFPFRFPALSILFSPILSFAAD
jgi:60S ribosomal subunit assembly/export protein LOC1